jgi:hypothetical protein
MLSVSKTALTQRSLTRQELSRLAQYWFRAELMREELQAVKKLVLKERELSWEFEAYLRHWLAALFVAVQGFNKLQQKDARVQKLFNSHLGHLKAARDETYHFVVKVTPFDQSIINPESLNWAEELHDALGVHVRAIVERNVSAGRIMNMRTTKRRK